MINQPSPTPTPTLAGQQVLAGQGALAGQSPIDFATQEALNNYAQLNNQYQAPLQSTPTYAPQSGPSPQQAQQIGDLMSLLAYHPVQSAGPNPDSVFLNGASGGQAQQAQTGPGAIAKGIWDNTLGGYIHLWQTNPEAAAAETLVGAGAMALTAVAPELALPIWAGFALMSAPHVLPQTLTSLADAWQDPNDVTVTKALINVGTAMITIGSPIKAFRGIGATRSILNDSARALHTADGPQQVADQVMAISKKAAQPGEPVKDVRDLIDPTLGMRQYEVIPQFTDALEAEIAGRSEGQAPINVSDEVVERLRQLYQVHGQLQRRVQEAEVAPGAGMANFGDAVANALPDAKRELDAFEHDDLIPAQKEFAHRYGYTLASEPAMPRMEISEINQVPAIARARADGAFRQIWGVAHGAGNGHGWDGVSDGVVHTDYAANVAEAMARGQAGGGLEHAEAVMQSQLLTAGRSLGVSDDRMEAVYRAIEGDATHESPEHYWDALSVNEKYLAQKLSTLFGVMTNYAYKQGHIELPLSRYVPRILRREGVEYGRSHSAFLRSPGNVESRSWVADDWGLANEMTDFEHHPDEELTLRPLSDRLRQSVKTREQFQGGEDAKAAAFQQTQAYRELLRKGDFGQVLRDVRTAVGQRQKNLIPKAQQRLEAAATRIADLEKQIPHLDGQVRDLDRSLGFLKGKRNAQVQRDTLRKAQQALITQLRPLTRELKQARQQHADLTQRIAGYQREVESAGDQLVRAAGDETARDLLHMPTEELQSIAQGRHVGGRKLLTGYHLTNVAFGRFLRQMNQARYREAWQSLARTVNDSTVRKMYGADAPMSVQELNLMDPDARPIAVPGDLPSGVPGAMLEGYVQVMPAIGRRDALNYQPPIFARADVAGRYKELAARARSSSELKTSFARGVYGVTVGLPKRLIMGSPAWHGKNVFGRYVTLLLDHPTAATSSLYRVLKERFTDPEAYYQTKLDHWLDGGVPANRHNVSFQVNHLEQQMTGQRTFDSAVRSIAGYVPHLHAQLAEGWFWKTVDDIGTAAYLVQKHRIMRKPWASDRVAGMLAAEHANNVAGMINPLYMDKLWKYGRQMAMFAPSWWTSFARLAGQAVPGSARMSAWLSKHPRLSTLDPVKMHSLDIAQRKELVRMGRSYFLTYMAAGMAVHDMMNVILSGHHIWDNDKGRWWDLQTDLSHPAQGDPETGPVRHAYMSGDLFFAQMADLMNVMGLGHDWGFLHQMQGDGYKQANARQKVGIIGAALGTGLQQRAAGKVGLPLNEAIGVGLGVDPYRLLRSGQAVNIPRTEALLNLLPAGTEAQIAIDDQRRLQTRLALTGDPRSQAQLQQLQSQGELPGGVPAGPVRGALKNQFLGLPSLYYAGDESPAGYQPLSDNEMVKYLQARQQILAQKRTYSEQLMSGGVSPYDWVKQNEITNARYQQLLSDTFQQSSTQGRLWTAYDALNKKYNLDNPNLSQGQFYSMLDARNAEWDNMLNSFSPNARAVWWDAHTSMWTDADYLYWLSRQAKDSVAASIDGEGGNHIRAMQNRLSSQGLPLTTAAEDSLRQQDPYLWTYYAVLKQMGQNTLLGSLSSAFSNPFASWNVVPDQEAELVQEAQAAGILKAGTFVRQSTMQGLGQEAAALSQASAPEAGRLPQEPEGQQFGRALTAEEAQQILASTNTSTLDPSIVQLLEALAARGGQ